MNELKWDINIEIMFFPAANLENLYFISKCFPILLIHNPRKKIKNPTFKIEQKLYK